jgi:hypothetical protein
VSPGASVRPVRRPSRRTVRTRNYPRSAIYGRTVWIYTQTVRSNHRPFGPLHRTVRPLTPDHPAIRTQNNELHNMRSSCTHRSYSCTMVSHRQHIITMSCHLMYTGSNILRPLESLRDIGSNILRPPCRATSCTQGRIFFGHQRA